MIIKRDGLTRHLFAGSEAVPGAYLGAAAVHPNEAEPSSATLAGRISPIARTIRRRFTIAEVNAGATLLAALAGAAYRMVDVQAVAVGGAAGAVTTVDVLGTQTTAKKLAAFGQAELTQSTVLRPGISGCTVLADGASFAACDANTAITVGKTGSNVTTATHIDIAFTYVIEPVV